MKANPKSNIKGYRKKHTEKVEDKNNKDQGHIVMPVTCKNVQIFKEIIFSHTVHL